MNPVRVPRRVTNSSSLASVFRLIEVFFHSQLGSILNGIEGKYAKK